MAKRKPRKKYDINNYGNGKEVVIKEVVIKEKCQPVSWKELQKIIADEFPDCPLDRLLIMTNDDYSLGIGEDAPKGFWVKM